MTRSRVIGALCLAILLIGGATWERFREKTPTSGSLVAITSTTSAIDITTDDANQAALDENNLETDAEATATDATSTDLTDTDMIGRQLFSDYVNLESNGQATDENIDALAGTYADNIAALDVVPSIQASSLHTTDDSETSLEQYSNTVSAIYNKYHNLAQQASDSAGDVSDPTGPAFASLMNSLSELYGRASLELESVAVPPSMVTAHVSLINNYLSSADATAALANLSKDPAKGFAALNTFTQNSQNEPTILSGLQSILASKGVTFSYSGT